MAQPRLPLFVITGTPGAGKSATAAVLMRRFPFGLHIPVDDLREWVVAGIAQPVPEFTEESGRQFRLARGAAHQQGLRYFRSCRGGAWQSPLVGYGKLPSSEVDCDR